MDEIVVTGGPRRLRSTRRATLPGASEFHRRARDVLAHLNDLAYLQTHPLFGVPAPSGSPSLRASASALRQTVVDAIRSLQPDARTPADSPAWRRYRILELRYQAGNDARSIQGTLAISKGEYYREHREAIQAVVDVLWERFGARNAGGEGVSAVRDQPRLRPRLPLPVPLTALIGRDPDMAVAREALTSSRLVTLTGPPGTGKTRLALELAREANRQFPDGVYFVPLAPITDMELVIPAIAQTIDTEPGEAGAYDGRSVSEQLVADLQATCALLVLDNFEQVVEAGPAVADLLQRCPQVRALVTSRVPLQVRGERMLPIPPLETPVPIPTIRAHEASESAAVQLFVERARGARPDFQLTDQNARVVAELCARLDGLPLALELAAARSDGLSPDGILDHLDLLSFDHGPRDLPARQRTLDAAIAWSYELLTGTEQALLRRLAVFSGGWYLKAAEEVAEQARVLDGLIALIRGSLFQRRMGSDGEGRFGMLETIRAYALQQLEAAGESDIFHCRHAEFFSTLIETSDWARTRPLVRTPDDGTDAAGQAREGLLGQVEEEEGNLRAALGWAVEDGDGPQALWLAAGLAMLGFYRGHSAHERPQLEAALQLPSAQGASPARAVALNVLGELAGQQGDDAAARALLQEELQIEEKLADERAAGFTLLALRRIAHREGHEAEGQALNERALGIFRAIGDPVGLAGAVTGLGVYALTEGDLVAAREYFEEALSVRRHLPALVHLGVVAAEEEKIDEARQLLQEFLQLSHTPYDGILIEALEALAAIAVADGRPARAFRLAGAAAGVRVPMSRPLTARQRSLLERALALASSVLDESGRNAAWAEGNAMTIEEAVQSALGTD